MPLTLEEAKELGKVVAEEVVIRLREVPELALHIAEHEVLGHAMEVDPRKARDPNVPARCFSYDTDEYCWKPGYIGLISSRKNPEQFATIKIKEPASPGVAERFRKIKGAISEAHREWEAKGEGLKGWWTEVGKKMAEQGIEL